MISADELKNFQNSVTILIYKKADQNFRLELLSSRRC